MIVTNVTKFTTICEIFDLRKKFFRKIGTKNGERFTTSATQQKNYSVIK